MYNYTIIFFQFSLPTLTKKFLRFENEKKILQRDSPGSDILLWGMSTEDDWISNEDALSRLGKVQEAATLFVAESGRFKAERSCVR